jgi:hypothetical protein
MPNKWEGAPGGGALAPVASGHPGISGALGRVSGFQRSACRGPGRKGSGHDAVERCSGLGLLSCDRCPGYAARGFKGRESDMACGSTQMWWRSRRATEVMNKGCTSFAGTGSGGPGRTLPGGMMGLAPCLPSSSTYACFWALKGAGRSCSRTAQGPMARADVGSRGSPVGPSAQGRGGRIARFGCPNRRVPYDGHSACTGGE